MNQGGGEEERFDKMEEKSTNLAWPTPGDSDVPPAEERAKHIHIYSLMVAREQGLHSEGETAIARTNSQSPRSSSRHTTTRRRQRRSNGYCESVGRNAIVRNDIRRADPSRPVKSFRLFSSFNILTVFVSTGFCPKLGPSECIALRH